MTEKQKVRKVIGTVTVQEYQSGEKYLSHGGKNCFYRDIIIDLPIGTKVEIVAEIEPELIRPEGVHWVQVNIAGSDINRCYFLQLDNADETLIAQTFVVIESYNWRGGGSYGYKDTLELGKRACEEALANAKMYGFYWGDEKGENEND